MWGLDLVCDGVLKYVGGSLGVGWVPLENEGSVVGSYQGQAFEFSSQLIEYKVIYDQIKWGKYVRCH